MQMNKSLFAFLLLVLSSLGLVACDKPEREVKAPVAITMSQEAKEQRLRERHAGRWNAVVAVDFDTVYEYATPEYRKIYSATHLHNQYAAQIERTSAKMRSVNYSPDGNIAYVRTLLGFRTTLPNGEIYEDAAGLDEQWRFIDGDWWFVEPR